MADADVTFNRVASDVLDRWKKVRDVCANDTDALRGYLPTLNAADMSAANTARNTAYRQRAVFYAATGFTLDGMIGLAFRHDPSDDLPDQLKYLLKDADGSGVSIYQQSQSALGSVVGLGRHGLYVDYSASQKRSVIKSYKAEDIINWRIADADGGAKLAMVVLRESREIHDGYEVRSAPQYRELRVEEGGKVTCRLWELDGDGKAVLVPQTDATGAAAEFLVLRSAAKELDFIPFTFIGSRNNDSCIDDSPLYGLADMNIAHYRNSADYEDMAFRAGQAQFWMAGLTTEWRDHLEQMGTLYVGSLAPMLLPTGGGCGFAQIKPNSVAKEAMDQKEKQMVALGARLIDRTQAAKTATEASGDRESSTSILAMCVANVSEAYQAATAWCARYMDIAFDSSSAYKINQDFVQVPSDPLLVNALVAAWQKGMVAKNDVRAFLRLQGTLAVDRTDEDIDKEIAAELPPPAPPNAPPLNPAPLVPQPA